MLWEPLEMIKGRLAVKIAAGNRNVSTAIALVLLSLAKKPWPKSQHWWELMHHKGERQTLYNSLKENVIWVYCHERLWKFMEMVFTLLQKNYPWKLKRDPFSVHMLNVNPLAWRKIKKDNNENVSLWQVQRKYFLILQMVIYANQYPNHGEDLCWWCKVNIKLIHLGPLYKCDFTLSNHYHTSQW